MLFSEEIYNAMALGYKFNIIKGYLFESANIFNEYIDVLYEIKQATLKKIQCILYLSYY